VTEAVGRLIDRDKLASYLDHHLGGSVALEVERHQAGHSNETFFVTRGDDRLVLRRPPLGAFLPSAHDVGREYKVLSGLQGSGVRVPRTVLACSDEDVIGAPFYVMERVDGCVIRAELPEAFAPEHRAAIGTELVDALVELHSLQPGEVGLGDFGKPAGYLERQLRRWTGQMELTLPHTRPVPDLGSVAEWLSDTLPASPPSTLVHGDYKLDNVMFAPKPPARLIAILDWEMSTIGDPLADLGWMVSFWRDPGDDPGSVFAETSRVTEMEGFLRRDDLIDRYATKTGRDVSRIVWYEVLAVWKLAILLEGSYARHLAGMTDDPFFAQMEHGVPELARIALALARGEGS
jgi:aminoglycoside phosphotransferase (APT) family kinase protein